jgi:hypothetical protein
MSAKKRTKKEMLALDAKIQPLYARGLGCRQIGETLNENPTIIFRRVRRMGILRSRSESIIVAANGKNAEMPFTRQMETHHLRAAATGDAIRWFLDRGYHPSLPIDVARYDLIVESDNDLKKVQIKTTTVKSPGGRWIVDVTHRLYDKHASASNASGKRRTVPYKPKDVDFFFIVTGDRSHYIIPTVSTGGVTRITLDVKFAKYKVS